MESYINTLSKMFNNGGDIHYVLPHFQREYIWEKTQWLELLRDLFFVYQEYNPDKPVVHFFGLMVTIPDGMINGTIPRYRVVDGQQRLITISLILVVLREIAKKKKYTNDLSQKIDKLITNYLEKEIARFKILPSTRHGDGETYISIINSTPNKVKGSLIFDAYMYIHRELNRRISRHELSLEKLFEVLVNCFQVALVILSSEESPYQIFESLDSKGKLLSQADLVRNYIAMTLPVNLQKQVFEEHWIKIETLLREQNKIGRSGELTAFIRHYLAMRRQTIYVEDRVYARFRDYIEQEYSKPLELAQEIGTIRRFSEYYHRILVPDDEADANVKKAISRLHILEASMTYPLLLSAYEERNLGIITSKELVDLLRMLENLVVRRYLCGESASILFKWFTTTWNEIKQERQNYTFTEACRRVITGKFYPTDRHLRQSIQIVKVYSGALAQNRLKIAFVLNSIEEHLWGKTDVFTQLKGPATIEHLMPRTLTEEWKTELGTFWEQTYKDYLHTLGNLTLVTRGKNTQLSNMVFSQKKRLLLEQGLRLNGYFTDSVPVWNDRAILTRAEWLAQYIFQIWPSLV